ncbi:MAG: glycosyltransferase family 39 protein [Chloroflexota bacterium]
MVISGRTRRLLALLAIILLATFVRFNGILAQSLWIDEGFTWNLTQYHDLFAILRQDVHPPLYFLMIDAWVEVAGTSIFAMRYFSLLPSVLSVVVVYQLAREILIQRGQYNNFLPLIAALVMAVAESETFLSQEVRSYTWHVLFACLSMLGFLRWHRGFALRHLLLWMLSTIALIYTFYLGAFIGVVQGLYVVLFTRLDKKLWGLGVLVISAIALMPWLALTASDQSDNISRAEWIRPDAFGFWLDDFRTKYFTRQWAFTISLAIGGIFTLNKKTIRLHPTGILLLLWFGVPLLLMLILNEFAPTYQPRRVSQIVPAVTLLIALGIGHIQGRLRWLVALIVVFYGITSTDFWRYKQPWREMVADTAYLITDGTPMLFELGGDDYAPRYHYAEALANSYDFLLDDGTPTDDANILIGLTTWRHLQAERYVGELPAIINSQDHWWLFYWSSDTGALDWLANFGFQRSATITVDFNPDVYLYRYDRVPETPLIQYNNGLQLRDVILHDDLTVELIWSTEAPLTADYTISVLALDANGAVIAQQDSMPLSGNTQSWQVGALYYDHKQLSMPTMSEGTVNIALVVYHQVDGEFVRIQTELGEEQSIIGEVNPQNN